MLLPSTPPHRHRPHPAPPPSSPPSSSPPPGHLADVLGHAATLLLHHPPFPVTHTHTHNPPARPTRPHPPHPPFPAPPPQALIYKEVNSLLPNWRDASVIEKADYLQEGAQGLLRALRLFDVRRGIAFSTYAVWHIRAYVLRAIRDKGRLVRLPQALQQDMQQIRKARYRFAVDQQGATPAAAQLAEMLSWTEDRVAAAITGLASSACLSLDADVDAPGDGAGAGRASSARSLGDGVAGGSVVGGCALGRAGVVNHAEAGLTVRDSFASTLAAAQRGRNPRRAEMTRLKYGLEDGREWTYQQLAARFNLTADGARGIVRAEVAYLRKEKAKLLAQFY